MSARTGILSVSLLLCFQTAADASTHDALARGDEAYARRAEGYAGLWANAEPVTEAIAAFEEALAAEPENQLVRAKLLRALCFKGLYVLRDRKARLRIFERGQILGEQSITRLIRGTQLNRRGGKNYDELVQHLSSQPNAGAIYYWSAAHWGLWGKHRGKIAAAKQGVAGKVRDYARIVNAIDPSYDGGGGHRMLGRLHAEAPKIPFVTGWIDRSKAISELEKAQTFSDDPLTLLYLIEALLEYDTSRRDQAMELLRALSTREPDSRELIKEIRAVSDARILLDRLSN